MNLKKIITHLVILTIALSNHISPCVAGFGTDEDGNPVPAVGRRDKPSVYDHSAACAVGSSAPVRPVASTKPSQPAVDSAHAPANLEARSPKSAQSQLLKYPTIFANIFTPKKALLAAAGITAGFGIAYATNSAVKNKVDVAGYRATEKAKSAKNRLIDWFSKPLTSFDVYGAAALASTGYLAYKSNLTDSLYQKSISFTDSCFASGTKAYAATCIFINKIPLSPAVLGSGAAMAGTGLLWYLYKRYTQPSKYIQAYRRFEASLRPNLQNLSEQYPKFIELYGLAEENPRVLLENYAFDAAPLVRLLKANQRRLLQEAIQLFDQQKKIRQ